MIAQEFKEFIPTYDTFNHFLNDLENDQNLRDKKFGNYFDSVENEIIEEERRIMDLLDSFGKNKRNIRNIN